MRSDGLLTVGWFLFFSSETQMGAGMRVTGKCMMREAEITHGVKFLCNLTMSSRGENSYFVVQSLVSSIGCN